MRALIITALLAVSGCSTLAPHFDAKPNPQVARAISCPPLKDYTAQELDAAMAEVPRGSAADQMLNDYFTLRELCR